MCNSQFIMRLDPPILVIDVDHFLFLLIPVETVISFKSGLNVPTHPLLANHSLRSVHRVLVEMPDSKSRLEVTQIIVADAPQNDQSRTRHLHHWFRKALRCIAISRGSCDMTRVSIDKLFIEYFFMSKLLIRLIPFAIFFKVFELSLSHFSIVEIWPVSTSSKEISNVPTQLHLFCYIIVAQILNEKSGKNRKNGLWDCYRRFFCFLLVYLFDKEDARIEHYSPFVGLPVRGLLLVGSRPHAGVAHCW